MTEDESNSESTILVPDEPDKELPKAKNKMIVVLGSQWGDEGKGKLVDKLAENADVVCRFQGGNNAGHTVVVNGKVYDFHLLPSGITNEKCTCVMGNGMVVHVGDLFDEIDKNIEKGLDGLESRLKISNRCHLVFDVHKKIDEVQEKERENNNQKSLGTTKKGIGPAYTAKAERSGLRMIDLAGDFNSFAKKFREELIRHKRVYPELNVKSYESELDKYRILARRIKPMICDTSDFVLDELNADKIVLAEGANATMLDIDFGTYPFVTSNNCSAGGAVTGLGIPPTRIGGTFGVVKAYTTRVGDGPFPTEQLNDIGQRLQEVGNEIGTTTGRKRRCGWLDLVVVKHTNRRNGFTGIALTKLDVLDEFEKIQVGIQYNLQGKVVENFPPSCDDLDMVNVDYQEFSGWLTKTENCRSWEDLPPNAKKYVKFIEDFLGVPVKWIGVGKERKAIISIKEGEINETV